MAEWNRSNDFYKQYSPSGNKNNSDFIPFNDSPGPSFTPPYYSSPKGSPMNTNNYRRKNWYQNRYSNVYQRPHNNSRGNYSGNFNQYRNSNSPQQHSSYDKYKNTSQDNPDMSSFLHPSFMEDPWAELEKKLKRDAS